MDMSEKKKKTISPQKLRNNLPAINRIQTKFFYLNHGLLRKFHTQQNEKRLYRRYSIQIVYKHIRIPVC